MWPDYYKYLGLPIFKGESHPQYTPTRSQIIKNKIRRRRKKR